MIITAAKGIIFSVDRVMLVENGGHIHLTKTWAQSLMHWTGLVKRKVGTKQLSSTSEKLEEIETTFLQQVGHSAKAHTIPAHLAKSYLNSQRQVLNLVCGTSTSVTKWRHLKF